LDCPKRSRRSPQLLPPAATKSLVATPLLSVHAKWSTLPTVGAGPIAGPASVTDTLPPLRTWARSGLAGGCGEPGADGHDRCHRNLGAPTGFDGYHRRIHRPGKQRCLDPGDNCVGGQGAVDQQDLDQRPGPVPVPESAPGLSPLALLGGSERSRSSGPGQCSGSGQRPGLVARNSREWSRTSTSSPLRLRACAATTREPSMARRSLRRRAHRGAGRRSERAPSRDIPAPTPGLFGPTGAWRSPRRRCSLRAADAARAPRGRRRGRLPRESLVELGHRRHVGHRDEMTAAETSHLALHATLFVAALDPRLAEEAVEM